MKKFLFIAAIAAIAPFAAHAESSYLTGVSSVSARLNFSIMIPKVLFLQVGTGTVSSNVNSVSTLTFAPAGNVVGNGSPVAGTGGDLSAGSTVTVRVLSNAGNVSLKSAVTGPLSSGAAGSPTVPWSEIDVSAGTLLQANTTANFTNGVITHPAFNDATGTTLTATNGILRQEGTWTFAYKNTTAPPAGTYTGTVTYTLAQL